MIPLILPFAVTMMMFLALWPLSVRWRDASLVDLAWGPGFGVVAVLTLGFADCTAGLRDLLLAGAIVAWSVRLGLVLAGRRIREKHEDPRYTALRESWGAGFWWKSLFGVFVLQWLVQALIALGPVSAICAADQSPGLLGWAGLGLAMAGLAVETVADAQLDRFKRRHGRQGRLCTTGLRAHLRHPNYAGEIAFWTGLGLLCAEAGVFAGLAAPALLLFLLLRVSGVPLLDERLSCTRPDYVPYRAAVPALVPRLRPYRSGDQ